MAKRITLDPHAEAIDRAADFNLRYLSAITGSTATPVVRPGRDTVCFLLGGPTHTRLFEFDPATGERSELVAVDDARKAVEAATGEVLAHEGLPFSSFSFVDEHVIRYRIPRSAVAPVDTPRPSLASAGATGQHCLDHDLRDNTITTTSHVALLRAARAVPRNVRPGVLASDPGPNEVPSPDGQWLLTQSGHDLAYRAVVDDRVVSIASGTDRTRLDVQGAIWSPSSDRVLVRHIDTSEQQTIPLVEWLKPIEQVREVPAAKVGGRLPDQQAVIVDIRTRTQVVADIPGGSDQTLTPGGWRHDGTEAYVVATDRRQQWLRLWAVDVADGASRLVCEETQPTFIYGLRQVDRFTEANILAGDEDVLWWSERDGWRHLYRHGTDGTLRNQVTSGDFEVLQVVHVHKDAEVVWVLAHSDLERPYDTHLCRVGLDGSGFTQVTEATGQHQVVRLPNGAFVDRHSDLDRPPTVDLLDTTGKVVATVTTADTTRLDELDLPTCEPFTALAADGETVLHGTLFLPPGFDPQGSYPVVEDIYGGPFIVHHALSFADPHKLAGMQLASLGFVAFQVDGRGTTERGKAFQDVAHGRFGEFHVEDHVHVLRQLVERHSFMDGSRVGVTGGSWGGYNTVRSLLLAPDDYHVGVAICPVYDIQDQMAQAIEPYMGLPGDRPEAFASGDSLAIADKLEGRLLLIHGTADANAQFGSTMKMAEALIRADKVFDTIVMPEADHHFQNAGSHQGRYMVKSKLRYFVQHLAPEVPTPA